MNAALGRLRAAVDQLGRSGVVGIALVGFTVAF